MVQRPLRTGRPFQDVHGYAAVLSGNGFVAPQCRVISLLDIKALLATKLSKSTSIERVNLSMTIDFNSVLNVLDYTNHTAEVPSIQLVTIVAENGASIGGTSSTEHIDGALAQTVSKPSDIIQCKTPIFLKRDLPFDTAGGILVHYHGRTRINLSKEAKLAAKYASDIQANSPEVRILAIIRNTYYDVTMTPSYDLKWSISQARFNR